MVRVDNKTGNLIIEVHGSFKPHEELTYMREALYHFIGNSDFDALDGVHRANVYDGIISILKQTEPTDEQWEQILKTDTNHK